MSNTFFVSDTHFGHANIIKYCQRPYATVQEMNDSLIENWNRIVKPNDVVWHLGDFAFMQINPFTDVLKRLNGQINVVLGNHDHVIIRNRKSLLENNLLSSVRDYAEVYAGKKMLVLFHYGQRVWNKSHHGSIHLYGHSHGTLPPFGRSVDVGIDCKEITEEYRPVALDEVIEYMSKKKIEVVDHHNEETT